MCVNGRWIFNPYNRQKIFVRCGKCEACQQERALSRTQRIRNHVTNGYINLFCTLTYANDYVPYVLRDELRNRIFDVNVYRDNSIRFVFSRNKGLSLKKESGTKIINTIYVPIDLRHDSDINNLKHLVGAPSEKIGVCYTPDIQNFFKRLNQILKRNYDIQYKVGWFYCSEYGSEKKRPHFHCLISCKSPDETSVRKAVLKAWPYADMSRTNKYIEIARDASSYVSSYVNCSNSLLPFLSESSFKQKHNYSRNYGTLLYCFSLASLLRKIESGNLEYYSEQKYDGTTALVSNPIPSYVINRYFPKFKGYSRLSSSQLRSILLCPADAITILLDKPSVSVIKRGNSTIAECSYSNKLNNPNYDFSYYDVYKIYVSLENAFQRFHRESGLNRYDYADYFVRAWNAVFNTRMKFLHCPPNKDIEIDYNDFYDNNLDVLNGDCKAPTLEFHKLSFDPNARQDIKRTTDQMKQIYYQKDKQRKVTNFVMVANGHNV